MSKPSSSSSSFKLLRGSISSSAGPSSQPTGSFVLPCRKLILNYSESKASSAGVRNLLRTQNSNQKSNSNSNSSQQKSNNEFLELLSKGANQKSDSKLNSSHTILDLANRFPQTEIVVQQNESREPTLTALYSE